MRHSTPLFTGNICNIVTLFSAKELDSTRSVEM